LAIYYDYPPEYPARKAMRYFLKKEQLENSEEGKEEK